MKPKFIVGKKDRVWTVDIMAIDDDPTSLTFGFDEPFHEETYVMFTKWCEDVFKTWLYPKRVRRMSFTQYHFASERDLDWFMLHWSGVDIQDF